MKTIYFFLLMMMLVACGSDTDRGNITVIQQDPWEPAPLKIYCAFDYQWQCYGCLYEYKSGDQVFICNP